MEEGAAGRPNAYSLSLVMVGLSRDGQHRAAAQLWAQLWAQGWVDTVALNSWMQCCVRCGVVSKALQAFQQVKAELPHLPLDVITFSTLVHGLVHKERTRVAAARALRLWKEMRQRGIMPDEGMARDVMVAALKARRPPAPPAPGAHELCLSLPPSPPPPRPPPHMPPLTPPPPLTCRWT